MRQYEEGSATLGDGEKGADKDGGDVVDTDEAVQCGGSGITTLREQELGSNGGNAEGAGGVPSLGDPEDIRYVRFAIQGGGMGVVIGGG